MNELQLTDEQAKYLIEILKLVFKKYRIDLKPGNKGELQLKSDDDRHQFSLAYYTARHRNDKMSIHIREKETNLNLARINIDPTGFHNNSDGKIEGNRILIFSSEEFLKKNDGYTHVKAFNLPETSFTDQDNLEQVFLDFLRYINVKEEGKIDFAGFI